MKQNYAYALVAGGLIAVATTLRAWGRQTSTARWQAAACGLLLLLLSALGARAQQRPAPSLFQEDGAARTAANSSRLGAALFSYRALTLDVAAMQAALATAPLEGRAGAAPLQLSLPQPDGSSTRFSIVEAPIMEAGLAARFPTIKTYRGVGLDDPTATVRLDFTPQGFHAQILAPGKSTVYIDPASLTDQQHYLSFFRHDMNRSASYNRPSCGVQTVPTAAVPATQPGGTANRTATPMAIGTQLRTYRLVVAATGEYTATKGGTVAGAQAAIVTTMNRVVGVYEVELAVRMLLVANNTSVVYTNAATDPYTDNDPNALLGQNQTNVDAVIGSANYDIGHVFTTGGGGLAALGVVCLAGLKAQGETGLPNPSGDVFAIDFVAHEMGHQFGANHTFNSGNATNCDDSPTVGTRNANTAYEPGSGSTIMAYAGICDPDNLQPNSDDYFHVVSFEEIETYLNSTGCGTTAATGNLVPAITALPANGEVLPMGTPFKLTATATDGNSDALTYCWEEYDLGPAGAPIAPQVAGQTNPLFRSFLPSISPTRYFPRLSDLVNNTSNIGERLPTVTRGLNFRVTVRDEHNGSQGVVGGIRSSTVVSMSATSAAGPFLVTAPNTALTWAGNSTQTVTWNVAGTTANGVNCATVNIRLSTDGGFTYPTLVLAGTANDGTQAITVPNVATTTARIMVEAADNYFFDISNANFTITATPVPTITSLSPGSGPISTSVTITGTNFTGATAVAFNGTAATFVVNNATTITATVPAAATTGTVTVTGPGGTATSPGNFTVTPAISSLNPTSGPVGTSVTITGTTFTGATAVSFNGTAAAFTVVNSTSITTSVPAGATTGNVTVTTPSGTSNGVAFTVTVVTPTPTITSFTPGSGPVGTSVTITGTNFTGATSVAFNGTAAAFTVNSATSISTTVPAGASTGTITVTTPGGTATSATSFTVVPAPTITSFTPASGPVGTVVTITGTNLTGATSVAFNGTAATTFTVNSATQITATVAAGTTTGTISVTTPGGTATSATSFTVLLPPTITSFTPTSGPVGTSVAITGTNFTGATAVSFNGTAAGSFTVNSATSISATVAAGTTTGAITVTTPGGTGTSATSFTVTVAPTDLVVSSNQTIPGGSYNNVTITGPTTGGAGTLILSGPLSVAGTLLVMDGGTFQSNCNVVNGPGSFTLAAGGTLNICSPAGISLTGATGDIQLAGTRSYSNDASYAYLGAAAQVTGPGLPATVRNLTIANAAGVTLSASLSIRQLLTPSLGTFTTTGQVLTLLSNAGGTAIVVFTRPVAGTLNGPITVQRFVDGSINAGLGYRHFSAPVTNTTFADLTTTGFTPIVNDAYNSATQPGLTTPFPTVFGYDQARLTTSPAVGGTAFDKGWFSPSTTGQAMTWGSGFTVNCPAGITPDFVGTPGQVTLTKSNLLRGPQADAGWHFLGNPYPSPIDWDSVRLHSGLVGMNDALYVFKSTGQYAGTYSSYVNGIGLNGGGPVLPLGQGFFVRTTSAALPGQVTFRNTDRRTTTAAPAFQRGTTDTRPLLHLRLNSAGAAAGTDETVVYFQSGATATGTDALFDASKLNNPGDIISLGTQMPGNETLAINGLPLPAANAPATRVPLVLTVPRAGAYRFEVASLTHFDPSAPVTLLDHASNTSTDLRLTSSYVFTVAQTGAQPGRFELLLGRPGSVTATALAQASQFTVYPNPVASKALLHVTLAASAPKATLTLHTLLGQALSSRTFSGTSATVSTAGLATGTYLLTVRVGDQAPTTSRVLVE
jgi:hypothetical protein